MRHLAAHTALWVLANIGSGDFWLVARQHQAITQTNSDDFNWQEISIHFLMECVNTRKAYIICYFLPRCAQSKVR